MAGTSGERVEIGPGEGGWREYRRRHDAGIGENVIAVRWDGSGEAARRILQCHNFGCYPPSGEIYLWGDKSSDGTGCHIPAGGWIVRRVDGKVAGFSNAVFRKWWEPIELKTADPAEHCYGVIESDSAMGLAAMVERDVQNGWKPTGGVAVSGGSFYQAMWRPAGWKAWAEPVGNFPPAGQSPVPKVGPEFRPEEDGAIGPKPAGKVAPEERKAVDPAEERRLIAWLSGLAKGQPGWVVDWVYKTAVGAKPHATIHLNTDDVMNNLFTGYWMSLKMTAAILFPWADLSIQPRRPVKPS